MFRVTFSDFVALGLAFGCSRLPASPPSAIKPAQASVAAGAVSAASEPHAHVYPERDWQNVAPEKLSNTVLWFSHILIPHDQVELPPPSFQLLGWTLEPPAARRSRPEALHLAQALADETRAHPDRFAELARTRSEDPATSVHGGALGAVTAFELIFWPEVLDALAVTRPGEVSEPVETKYGIHVLLRQPPPAAARLSGERIVIGYDEAPWLEVVPRPERAAPAWQASSRPHRSREQALALAQAVYERALAPGQSFAELIERYSEHRDALRGGDFGSWSNREPTPFRQELQALATLEPGEVGRPVDSQLGFQILRRTADQPRPEFAMRAIQLRVDGFAPDLATSRALALEQAFSLSRLLSREPSRFAEYLEHYCCRGVTAVLGGRESPFVEAALARLQVGEVAPEPILEGESVLLVVQRAALDELPRSQPPQWELPDLPLRTP